MMRFPSVVSLEAVLIQVGILQNANCSANKNRIICFQTLFRLVLNLDLLCLVQIELKVYGQYFHFPLIKRNAVVSVNSTSRDLA